jgi:hypothetical protein
LAPITATVSPGLDAEVQAEKGAELAVAGGEGAGFQKGHASIPR